MRCEVKKIVSRDKPYHGTSKSNGKPYVINSAMADVVLDGKEQTVPVKTMGNYPPDVGEYEATSSEYKGKVSWMLKKAQSGGGGYKGGYQREAKIDFIQYRTFVAECANIAKEIAKDKWTEIFPSVLGNANVMVERVAASGSKPANKVTDAKPSDIIKPEELKDELEF